LKADLLVLGTHGRGGFSKFAIGSIAEELLRIAPFPVMTVGPKADMQTQNAPCTHAILFATDFGPGSKRALPFVLRLTKAQNAKLILLHMIPLMPTASASLSAYAPASTAADDFDQWSGTVRTRALQQLREYLPANSGLEQEPEYLVGTDFLAEGILTAAGKFHVDLIMMGANRTASPKTAAHVPWTAVHEVLVQAPCPVMTFAG
jgi:nucleotide-binding universal stress UspA family protein